LTSTLTADISKKRPFCRSMAVKPVPQYNIRVQ